jgi:hypothetical protein
LIQIFKEVFDCTIQFDNEKKIYDNEKTNVTETGKTYYFSDSSSNSSINSDQKCHKHKHFEEGTEQIFWYVKSLIAEDTPNGIQTLCDPQFKSVNVSKKRNRKKISKKTKQAILIDNAFDADRSFISTINYLTHNLCSKIIFTEPNLDTSVWKMDDTSNIFLFSNVVKCDDRKLKWIIPSTILNFCFIDDNLIIINNCNKKTWLVSDTSRLLK